MALQSGIAAMQMLVWQNNAWRQSVTTQQAGVTALIPLGLQVAMQVQNVEAPMSKSFLLGGI